MDLTLPAHLTLPRLRASRDTCRPLYVVRTTIVFSPGCTAFRTSAPAAVCFKSILYPPFAATASALALLSVRCKQYRHHHSFTMVARALNGRAYGWTTPNHAQIQFMVEHDALHKRQLAASREWSRARADKQHYVCIYSLRLDHHSR